MTLLIHAVDENFKVYITRDTRDTRLVKKFPGGESSNTFAGNFCTQKFRETATHESHVSRASEMEVRSTVSRREGSRLLSSTSRVVLRRASRTRLGVREQTVHDRERDVETQADGSRVNRNKKKKKEEKKRRTSFYMPRHEVNECT